MVGKLFELLITAQACSELEQTDSVRVPGVRLAVLAIGVEAVGWQERTFGNLVIISRRMESYGIACHLVEPHSADG